MGENMRIGIFTSNFPSSPKDKSGAGAFVREIAVGLKDEFQDVTVISPKNYLGDDIQHVAIGGLNSTSLRSINSSKFKKKYYLAKFLFIGMVKCVSCSRRLKFDVIVSFWSLPSGIFGEIVRRTLGIRHFVWVLGSDINDSSSYPLGNLFNRIIAQNAEEYYSDGLKLAETAHRITGREPKFLPAGFHREISSSAQQLSPNPYLLSVGRLHSDKGFDVLIYAYSLLMNEKLILPELHIWGEGGEEADLKSLIKALKLADVVKMKGVLTDENFVGVLTNAAGIIIPSRTESIPIILGEAARFGRRLLVTDVGDMGNLVKRFDAGFIAMCNAKSIADELEKLVKSDEAIVALRELAEFLSPKNSVREIISCIKNG
jgi:glycosyltransferase involved in cell wall biosynthesis